MIPSESFLLVNCFEAVENAFVGLFMDQLELACWECVKFAISFSDLREKRERRGKNDTLELKSCFDYFNWIGD